MSNQTRKLLVHGLVLAACTVLRVAGGVRAEEPPPMGQAGGVAPQVEPERYLLLTDGRLIKGVITRDGSNYLVKQPVGVIRYSGRLVERAFDSVRQAYAYRLERVPEDDPAERLRLARWCLSWHLEAEARTLLNQVVEISPDHGPARAMLTSIAQTEAARLARRQSKLDEGIKKTAGEEVVEDRPGALDSAVLRGAERRMGITGLPVIFDLPPAVAVQRTEQFKRYVHPILQADCARCHNQTYNGAFQLVPVKSAREKTPDAIRANLDATLRLIDPENPDKSEVLTVVLLPHGLGNNRRPIYMGSNDRHYQVLSNWVTSLRGAPAAEPAAGPRALDSDEAFATGRERKGDQRSDEAVRRTQLANPRPAPGMTGPASAGAGRPSYRYVQGRGMMPEESGAADPREFPLPYAVDGAKPALRGADPAKVSRPRSPAMPREAAVPGQSQPERPGPGNASDADLSAPATKGRPDSRSGDAIGPPTAGKKPVRIDPKILEKFLQRNAPRAGGQ